MSLGLLVLCLVVAVNVIGGLAVSIHSAVAALQARRDSRRPAAPPLRLVPSPVIRLAVASSR
jgi:hypothetical protein